MDGATHLCAQQLAAFRIVIGWFALSISPSCHCWAVHVVVGRFVLLLHGPLCVVWPTWLSCRPPCCHVARPVVVSPALVWFAPSGCRFTRPVLVRPFVVGFHLGVAVLSLCRSLRCIAVFVALQCSLRHCGHPDCTFVTILVAPLLPSSLLRGCRYPSCIIVVVLVAWPSSFGSVGSGKREVSEGSKKQGQEENEPRHLSWLVFVMHRVGFPPSWVPPLVTLSPRVILY